MGARLLAAAWGLVLVAAVGYARVRLTDMMLDPAKGDFWWSAWMTIVGLGNGLVAVAGALLGRARPQGSAASARSARGGPPASHRWPTDGP